MSTEVGTAYVSLLPSARGFAAATSRELGRATPGIRQVGGKAGQAYSSGFLPGIKSVHTAIIGLGGLAVAKFAKDSVKAFSESEDAENKLNFAYQKFPKLADVSRQSLTDLATAMQRKTVFDDESLKSGEAVLSQFNLTGKQVEQILPLVADYAAKTGRDIPEASTLVGKALLGNARALKEMGISFKATGNTGRDYAAIQQLISDKVGGFAENQGKTAAGQAKILANQFNELQETVGSLLVPALSSLVGIITPLLEAFGALPKPLQDVILGVVLLSTAAVVIIPRLGAVKAGLVAMGIGGDAAAAGLTATAVAEGEVGAAGAAASGGAGRFIGGLKGIAGAAGIVGILLGSLSLLSTKLDENLGGHVPAAGAKAAEALLTFNRAGSFTSDTLEKMGAGGVDFGDIIHNTFNRGIIENTAAFGREIGSLGGILPWNKDDAVKRAGTFFQTVDNGLQSLVAAGRSGEAADVFLKIRAAVVAQGGSVEQLNALLPNYTEAIGQAKLATDGATKASAANATVTDQMRAAYAKASLVYNQFTAGVETSFRIHAQARQATADATQAIKDLGKAHNKTRIDIDKAMISILDAADAAAAAVTGVANKNHAYRDELTKLRAQTAPGSALRKTLDGYIARLGAIPKSITTKVFLDIANAVANSRRLQEYEQGFASGRTAAPSAGIGNGLSGAGSARRRAMGGPVMAGHPYLIGERGPELWVPNMAGWVVPNGSSATRGGDTWNVWGPSAADVAREAENLRRRRDLLAGARA